MKLIAGKDGIVTAIGSQFSVCVDGMIFSDVSYIDTSEGFIRLAVPVKKKDGVEVFVKRIDPSFTSRYEPKESVQVIEFFSKNIKFEIS